MRQTATSCLHWWICLPNVPGKSYPEELLGQAKCDDTCTSFLWQHTGDFEAFDTYLSKTQITSAAENLDTLLTLMYSYFI